jgi:Uma2 family endonuclease
MHSMNTAHNNSARSDLEIPVRRRLTLEEWARIVEVGIFLEDERLELVRGEIVEMEPVGRRESFSYLVLLNHLAYRDLDGKVLLSPRCPIVLSQQQSELYPDLALLIPREDYYRKQTPGPADVLLLIEIAELRIAYDRSVKMPLYAEAGISETWLVDLKSETIFVHRQPSPAGYQDVHAYRRGEAISPETFPDVRFTVDEILG